MAYKKKNIPPGKRSPFNLSLKKGVNIGRTFPPPIHELLKLWPVKRLLNWMAMDPDFQQKILDQVPQEDPPEPSD